ncbi:MAG: bifunctional 4-hydroxy-2-oxoglutarate aldolase/2-dehydro-3-deoxy-phosphogluconate aldolase [Akkermansiaceae bacterium]|jgi:2-dehydro-3-deoxyphosphogluconate aldolase / (4S)-4-hydroxy-2-oxoglutarate aldolase|nr:bifunctional 4-hydroxy-2-oxoglutarate aldolase/2-dehydro-3-deoxy-phosphogluconate aldolase [Akkermansiaceae bacterium]MDP4646997.1 bifunctional 4-hydroxy-2-oxoglutarate aldolase/2-dehydro-3-deoxy-phosphogluconate aldolase [Akkermansiaceae bacterium]MDP4722643.1 bifunctional 4-hydroxy-2-oxoglutarate aldolase/2-dehydro-3-deoxy-phosphogluconate aldolase [Akkermansiaceae bacterium]MDP4780228.1 bifunctional 4-hydroxy-2-oxoglutarate aldolase/2-dehydro-3-deoxy-phosphogluconate aldolase [Akkermansiac
MKEATLKQIQFARIVPVVVIDDADVALDLADALLAAGLGVIEITFRTAAAAKAIETIASERPAMLVGAGTLLTGETVKAAADAGATFGLAPGLNARTVADAQGAGLDFAPGISTPSEIEHALALGCKLLKFFPAEQAGGANMLKALEGPYAHTGVQFIPTGGISAGNMNDYLSLKSVAAIGGSWFVDKKLIAARDWDAIERLTREALAIARAGA